MTSGLSTISVVIPARNEGANVQRTLESLSRSRAETSPAVEVVIVDDASDDTQRPAVRDVHGLDVTVVRSRERIGVPAARNAGVAAATGNVVFITDAHVSVSEGWYMVIREHAREDR